jgi:hypothetical protein
MVAAIDERLQGLRIPPHGHVDTVERVDEIGQLRRVERRPQARDVHLCELVPYHGVDPGMLDCRFREIITVAGFVGSRLGETLCNVL